MTNGALLAGLVVLALTFPTAASADVPLPPNFTVHVGPCPDPALQGFEAGCAYPDGGIYVSPGPSETALFWHEIGHVFDFELLTPADRAFFTRVFGIHGPWFGGDPVDSDGQPASEPGEVFADEDESCARHLRPGTPGWDVGDNFEPSRPRHRRICQMIHRIGLDPSSDGR